jgi:putative ABC transport system ATP-binding protein
MYRLSGVTREYGHGAVLVLRGVDLDLADGEWLAVRGPTGHGKSTLLQIMGGLDRPTRGMVELDGRDLARMSETGVTKVRARLIGFVFQSFNLVPTLSAAENVETALVPLGVRGAQRRRRAAEALAAVGLADRADHLPSDCPAASSSARRSPARWSKSRPCCSPTSRPATSTRTPGTTSSGCLSACGASGT